MWMNQAEIEQAYSRYGLRNDAMGKATQFLLLFMEQVNMHSDGWPYWSAPGKASAKLQKLVHDYMWRGMGAYPQVPEPTMADFKKTLPPIKAFMTRKGKAAGMVLPEFES